MPSRCVLLLLVASLAFVATVRVAADPTPAECYTACAATFSSCAKSCKAGDASCYAACTQTYQQTCLPKCGMPVPPSPPLAPTASASVVVEDDAPGVDPGDDCREACFVPYRACSNACRGPCGCINGDCGVSVTADQCWTSCAADCMTTTDPGACSSSCPNLAATLTQPKPTTPVTGARECVKECKTKGKEAADKCKHEKFARRAACYAQVPNTVKACESGCIRPHGLTLSAPAVAIEDDSSDKDEPSSGSSVVSRRCLVACKAKAGAAKALCWLKPTEQRPQCKAQAAHALHVCAASCESPF